MSKRFISFFLSAFLMSFSATYAVDLSTFLKAKLDNNQALNAANDQVKNAANFYKARHYQQIWVKGDGFTSAAETVLDVLKKAAVEGLEPSDYARALELVEEAKSNSGKLLEAEIALTALALEYVDDLLGERLNPRKIGKALYLKAKNIDAVQIMTEAMAKDPSGEWLTHLTISHPEYQLLKSKLAEYRAQSEQSHYPNLSKGKKIELKSTGGRVETLQWQLSSLGYLTEKHSQGTVDIATEQAIKSFQEENHLKVDGIVGTITVAALNSYNLDDRIRQIIVSMERWRWLPEDLGKRYVLVNIAGFELAAIENGVEKLRMPVIIGRTYRKTPVFSSKIDSVRFNPSWHVPRSIAVKDKLKKIRKDPAYLTRGGYILYNSHGDRMNPHNVNWGSVSASNFNFRIRQNPGSNNALGKIRFAIKSPFNVYLHSTPDKHLFEKEKRNFSSGCIRVGDPKSLAVFVFNDEGSWPYDRIAKNMEGTQTQNVPIKNPVNVYISYFTVWKGSDSKLRFSQDLYGQDKAIWDALQSRKKNRI
ncbi:MAG TPA: hypothetical protein DD412_02780 [Holosporales bacterium]|nr:hypothetical protein [Holosporales bacterium]